MKFEWDPKKPSSNLKKNGVSFEASVTVFYDPLSATFDDPDHSVTKARFITIGYPKDNRLLFVSHSDQEQTIRIISARIATAHERMRHEDQT